jgi:transcriptional regulator with XRE-family HTH domain
MISNENVSEIGERIKKLREERGITQAEFAKKINVKRETVNQWENGSRDLKTDYTVKVAEYFGVSCDFILRGIEYENVNICKKTGLVNEAIKILGWCHNSKEDYDVDILNTLIVSQRLPRLIEQISRQLKNLATYEKLKDEEKKNIVNLFEAEKDIFMDEENARIAKLILTLNEKAELEEYRIMKTLRNAVDNITNKFIDMYKEKIEQEKWKSGINKEAE